MVDKGWRKRLHDKKPKTPTRPKPVAEDALQHEQLIERPTERLRSQPTEKLGWRRIYHGSRPETPAAPSTIASGGDDTEDTYSEKSSEVNSGRGRATPKAPKLNHYLSAYRTLSAAEEAQEFSFSSPWGLFPPPIEPPIDLEISIQKIRSHIGRRSWVPLPVEYNSGILRVFEDHRKVSEKNEMLNTLTRDTLEAWQDAQEAWTQAEELYQKEIRRLELLIAQGKSGLSGLMKARQGSIVDRRRLHRQAKSVHQPERVQEGPANDQLDEKIRLMSMEVSLQRPTSPSGMMTALSRKLTTQSPAVELPVGTPPRRDPKGGLSRKVKSELDLMKLGTIAESSTQSVPSGVNIADDSSPVEANDIVEPIMDIGVECEAFVALRELAALVARRRGMDVEAFVSQLMRLFSNDNDGGRDTIEGELTAKESGREAQTLDGVLLDTRSGLSQRRLRRFRSEPQLAADNRRRHFSFEPGDDHLGMLNEQLREFERNRPKSPAGSQSTNSSASQDGLLELTTPGRSLSSSQTLGADAPKPSKIPSPLHQATLGRPRRENSSSSLRTVSGRDRYRLDDRRDSRSSVLTAVRPDSNGSLRRPEPASRSSSITNFRPTDIENRDPNGRNRLRNSTVALAAARVANSNHAAEPKVSETSNATYPQHSALGKTTFSPSTENEYPPKRG